MKIKHPIFGDIFPMSRWKKTFVAVERDSDMVPEGKDMISVELFEKIRTTAIKKDNGGAEMSKEEYNSTMASKTSSGDEQ